MKKGNTATPYIAPEMEIMEIEVEAGFAASGEGEADDLEDMGEW